VIEVSVNPTGAMKMAKTKKKAEVSEVRSAAGVAFNDLYEAQTMFEAVELIEENGCPDCEDIIRVLRNVASEKLNSAADAALFVSQYFDTEKKPTAIKAATPIVPATPAAVN
jgi:hypothetical protein